MTEINYGGTSGTEYVPVANYVPAPPTDLSAIISNIPGTSFRATWVAPIWTGNSDILNFKVYCAPQGSDLVLINTLASGVNTVEVTSLTPGLIYILGIKATNVNGDGAIATIKLYVPKAPTVISTLAVRLVSGIPVLSWVEPVTVTWETVTKYNIYMSYTNSPYNWTSMCIVDSSVNEASHIMATANKTYYYAVSSMGSGGIWSDLSNIVSVSAGTDAKMVTYDNQIINGSFDASNIDNWVAPEGKSKLEYVDTVSGLYYEKALIVKGIKIYQPVATDAGQTIIFLASGITGIDREDKVVLSKDTTVLESIDLVGYVPQRYYAVYNTMADETDLRLYLVGTETFNGL